MLDNYSLKKTIDILVLEDNEIDVEALQRAFRKANITNPLYHAYDGVEALEVLCRKNEKPGLSQPCIIQLDINMPRMNGFELLQELRQHEVLKQNIVFMLTTSKRNEDCARAYNFNVAGYVVKEDLGKLVDMLDIYCEINKFPSNNYLVK